jgi:hypothetical protein
MANGLLATRSEKVDLLDHPMKRPKLPKPVRPPKVVVPTPEPELGRFILSANAIIGDKYYPAGERLPYKRVGEIPDSLKGFLVKGEPNPSQ